ncbi:50S ribosomal protein L16, partial [Acidithiobacillus sp. GGI-221]
CRLYRKLGSTQRECFTEEVAREAFALGAAKLPVQTAFVSRRVMG